MYESGPESQKLVLVMVGLPARGKSYTGRKMSRYLSWLGYATRVFNVGEYRRAKLGAQMSHNFFDPHNEEGAKARRALALDALEDMVSWMHSGGDIAIYDATNSTKFRRKLLRERCDKEQLQLLFVEIFCEDQDLVEANIKATKLSSPDYQGSSPEDAVRDFRARIAHYERAYEGLEESEGSYIRVIDAGRKAEIHALDGYLASRLVFFLTNLHITQRPIFFTRHGESLYNKAGLIGGDPDLSAAGQQYAHSLSAFIDGQSPALEPLTVWTSSLRRTVQTANPLGRSSTAWRALDEIDAGVCDGMTYEQIRIAQPDEYEARKQDKFRYRYPRGESYQDVIQRLQHVIIELERTRRPTLVIAHQAVLRALYAYFMGIPPQRCPHLPIPLHTVIRLSAHAYGTHEQRFPLEPRMKGSVSCAPSRPQ